MSQRRSKLSTVNSRRPDLRGLIWDFPTRLFHWSLVTGFGICYLTGEDDRLALLHITSGYMIAGLVTFRLIWGFIGSRHARFSAFLRGPQAILQYLLALLRGRPPAYAGHNPAGALAIVTLLLSATGACASGILLLEEVPWPPLEWLHEWLSTLMLGVAILHVAGVLITSVLHRENLIKAMITGRKRGFSSESVAKAYPLVATCMALAMIAFWLWSYRTRIF